MISPEVLSRIPYNQYYDMTTLVEACIRDKVRVGSFPVHEYWTDIGRMDDLEEARNGFSENFNQ